MRNTSKVQKRKEKLKRIATVLEGRKQADAQNEGENEKLADRIQNMLHTTNEERAK